jgi:hypothetical protein
MTPPSTSMYLIYIDESYDETHFVYSAMFVDAFRWNSYFNHLLEWRREWFEKHQIALDTELHATDFIAGRGQPHHNRDKVYRAELFYEAIGRIEKIADIKIINAITSDKKRHLKLFEWMLTRINNTLKYNNAFGVLICDEGNENKLTSVVRTMQKENHIPDRLDMYGFNGGKRNMPLERIIEDPLFKTSKSSYFIQMSDFLAFSLLRNEKPISGSTQPRVSCAFEQLDKTLVKVAFRNDPKRKGIIRI